MKLLFLTVSRCLDISTRGIYTDLMRRFVSEGHDVYIVTVFEKRFGRRTEVYESGGAKILGVRTLNIQKTNVIEKGIGTLLLERQFMAAIKKYYGDIQFDLVLYSTPPITLNSVIAWAKRKHGAKSYLMLKDIFPQNAVDLGMFSRHSPFSWYFRRKERQLYRLSDHIGCMSPANRRYVIEHNPFVDPAAVELCPNSIEIVSQKPIDVSEVRQKYGIPDDKVFSIYGGNLGKPQGIDFLIETVASNEKRLGSFMLVVGSGTEFGKIKAWFDAKHPQNAMLLSALPKSDYDVLMRSADIGLIFLDRRFTIPNYPSRLLSYLENRVPVMLATDVNTDIGTIAEQNAFGFWAESGDIGSFDRLMDRLIADEALRSEMGERGYQFLREHYTVDKTAATILKHFDVSESPQARV